MSGERIEIEGNLARLYRETPGGGACLDRRVALPDLLREVSASAFNPHRDATFFLPPGTRFVKMRGATTVVALEQPPQVRRVTWSPGRRGRGGEYASYRLAFPYIVYLLLFSRGDAELHQGELEEMRVYYRPAPLRSADDPLAIPNLFNVQADPTLASNCRACLRGRPEELAYLPLAEHVEALLDFFWGAGFNLDIEQNGFERARDRDPRIASLEAWEGASTVDPLFPLEIAWEPAGHTLREVADRLVDLCHSSAKPVGTAADLADVMYRLRELP